VLIVGSGLTAVDKVIELNGGNHRGEISVISRHGLFPRVHLKRRQGQLTSSVCQSNSAIAALRNLRHEVANTSPNLDGDTWRRVVDGLRSQTQKWWHVLPLAEKRRFLRHLSTHWDIHRHRMAPEIGVKVEQMLSSGQLKNFAGRIISVSSIGDEMLVKFKERGTSKIQELKVSKIINCTGPQSSLRTIDSALLDNLLSAGLIAPHNLGTGIATRADGQILDSAGNDVEGMFAIGPLLKAELLESVAVPELKQQAYDLAIKICEHVKTSFPL
jgi:uncharacterized NAD(P)/FAD-binding protein YdhS